MGVTFSKLRLPLEFHLLSSHRMREVYRLGVQAEAASAVAVEAVAAYGRAQSGLVCAVQAQLVGASRVRKEGYARCAFFVPFTKSTF